MKNIFFISQFYLILTANIFSQTNLVKIKAEGFYSRIFDELVLTDTIINQFNQQGQLISEKRKSWDTDSNRLINYSIRIFSYKKNCEEPIIILKKFDNEENEFKNRFQFTTKCDENGNLIEQLTLRWNEKASYFLNEDSLKFFYNLKNKPIQEEKFEWDESLSKYVLISKYTYTYDENGKIILENNVEWNEDQKIFINDYNLEYTYENDQCISKIQEEWNVNLNKFEPFSKRIYLYEKNKMIKEELFQRWNVKTSSFINRNKESYHYNENNELIRKSFEQFNEDSNSYKVLTFTNYYY